MRRALPYIILALLSVAVQSAAIFAADEQSQTISPHMINDVRYWSGGEFTRVVIDLTGDAHFAVNRIESPSRVYFDFAGCKLVKSAGQIISVEDRHIGTVRTGQYDPSTVRVVVDLKDDIGFKVFRLTGPSRVVVDVFKREGGPSSSSPASVPAPAAIAPVTTAQAAPERMSPESLSKVMAEATAKSPRPQENRESKEPQNVKEPRSTLPALPEPNPILRTAKAEPPATPEPSVAQEAVSPSIQSNTQSAMQSDRQPKIIKGKVPPPLKRIVIDPGHGGKDPGAVGLAGLKEKDVSLDMARRLKRELESRGYEVILTRSRDMYLDLEERAVLANQRDADLFVSVHVNANRNPSVRGIETYVLKWSDEQSSQEVAERENMVSARRMKQGRDDVGVMLASLALAHKSEQSAHLATKVQDSMEGAAAREFSPAPSNKAKGAMFYVLYGAKMPAILVELAYVTNRDDAARLRNTKFRDLMAGGIADGIDRYFKEPMPHLRVAMR